MKFDSSTPRTVITVQGTEFSCPQPYIEGHTLNSNEAAALNQLLCENLRNNVAGKIKPDEQGVRPDFSQSDFDAYAAEYEFGVRRSRGGGEARLPPEEREARKIAREKIIEKLKEKGIKVTTVGADKMEELVSTLAQNPEIRKEAEARVKRLSKIGLDSLGLDDLMSGAGAPDQDIAA